MLFKNLLVWTTSRQHIWWKTNLSVQTMKTSTWTTRCWSRGHSGEVGGVIYKNVFANHPSHLPWALPITPPSSLERLLITTFFSCDLDWNFHNLLLIPTAGQSLTTRRVTPFWDSAKWVGRGRAKIRKRGRACLGGSDSTQNGSGFGTFGGAASLVELELF
jgi:hypothetical protein